MTGIECVPIIQFVSRPHSAQTGRYPVRRPCSSSEFTKSGTISGKSSQ